MNAKSQETISAEDEILPTVFFMYKIIGMWYPTLWDAKKKWMYNIYTVFAMLVAYSVVVTDVLYVNFSVDSFNESLQDDLYLVAARLNIWFRMISIVCKRERIIELLESCAGSRWRRTQDEKEVEIRNSLQLQARYVVQYLQ